MKAIRITEERQNQILPQNIKETDVLSDNAKKTLATIMNYYVVLEIVKTSKFLVCPNTVLREAVGIRKNDLLSAVQELIECGLIIREIGKRRTEGEKGTASVYRVIWENLTKPIKKKETFEELFSEFLKPSETPLGTAASDTVSVSVTVSDTNTDTEAISDSEVDTDVDIETEDDFETEVETDTRFSVECYEPVQRVPDVEDLSSYLRRVGRL